MQDGYVHAMLKSEGLKHHQRRVIIFRSGCTKEIAQDSGQTLLDVSPPDRTVTYMFGPMKGILEEGACYSRKELMQCGAHL